MRKTVLALTLLAMSGMVCAADVTVVFEQPEKYTDIKPANDTRSRFERRVTETFEGFFNKLAAKLPEGYKWQVTVTDIDLAGDVDHFAAPAGQALRIVKDIHSPAIRFTHTLTDNQGNVLLAGEERIRDMAFMQRTHKASIRTEFAYEQVMLEDWFAKTVQPLIAPTAK